MLTLDRVYVRGKEGALEFHTLAEATLEEVADVARRGVNGLKRSIYTGRVAAAQAKRAPRGVCAHS